MCDVFSVTAIGNRVVGLSISSFIQIGDGTSGIDIKSPKKIGTGVVAVSAGNVSGSLIHDEF